MSGGRRDEIPDLREHLLTCVLPFWARHSVDQDHGGFITHLARDGSITDASAKFLVMQARMIYSFAVGAELGGDPEWLNLARQGASFLLQHFRDVEQDGWFWSVTGAGEPRETAKRAYGHAFVIYALAEYGRTVEDSRALAAATHTWSLTAERFWDREHGGLFEACDRAWNPTDRGHSMGTHLHVLEALLALNDAVGGDRYWPHVREICDLMLTHMVDRQHRCGLEKFPSDWRVDPEASRHLVNYGHNLEAAWLLLRANQIEEVASYRDAARDFLDYSLRYGLDTVHGGVFSHGPFGEAATAREKIWWVQTEAMVAFLLGHLVFGDRRYWEAFQNVVRFCLRHLHDPEYGEWYHSTAEDGGPRNSTKGSAWKAAYHVTQACAYGHQYLTQMGQI